MGRGAGLPGKVVDWGLLAAACGFAVLMGAFADAAREQQQDGRLRLNWAAYLLTQYLVLIACGCAVWATLPRPDKRASSPPQASRDEEFGCVRVAVTVGRSQRLAGPVEQLRRVALGTTLRLWRCIEHALRLSGRACYSIYLWHFLLWGAPLDGRTVWDNLCRRDPQTGEITPEGCNDTHHDVLVLFLMVLLSLLTYRYVEFGHVRDARALFCLEHGR